MSFTKSDLLAANSDCFYHAEVKALAFSHLWTIDKFSLNTRVVGAYIESSKFIVDNTNLEMKWFLRLYPYGFQNEFEGSLSLFLNIENPNRLEVFTNYTLSVLKAKQERTNVKSSFGTNFSSLQLGRGCVTFLKHSDLMSKASELLPNDQLTISCELTIFVPTLTPMLSGKNSIVELKDECRVCAGLTTFVNNKLFSDVTLVMRTKEFSAHKVILATRSCVFAAMFQNDMQESKKNIVTITDIDEQAFENVLNYIYTGKTSTLNGNLQVREVLYAANKYELHELKTMCEIALSKLTTVENAAEMLAIADQHSSKILNISATQFISDNCTKVIESEGWKVMEACNSQLTYKMYREIIARRIAKSDS